MLDTGLPAEASSLLFVSSDKSRTAQSRKWIWTGFGISIVFCALMPKASVGSVLLVLALLLPYVALSDWLLRWQLKPGRAMITLSTETIASPHFRGKRKTFEWNEIAAVSSEALNGIPVLQLRLNASDDLPAKRRIFSGLNLSGPYISLAALSDRDQERLMGAVSDFMQAAHRDKAYPSPVEDNFTLEREFRNQLKALAPHTWVTYALVAINVAVWLAMVIISHQFTKAMPGTLLGWGGNAASEVQQGQWWRLLTSMFVHATPVHLLSNMLGLIGAGMMVERIYGHRLYLLIYIGAGLMGSALSMHFAAQAAVSVGASSAIFGIAGALVVACIQHRKQLPKMFGKQTIVNLGIFILYSLGQGFSQQGIDNAAHVGGLLAGCTLALILPERFNLCMFMRTWKQRASIALLSLCVAVPALANMAPAAQVDQRKVIIGTTKFEHAFKRLDAELHTLQQEQADIKAGKSDVFESDERNHTVHAKAFQQIYAELQQASLSPRDPRNAIRPDGIRFAALMAEALAMPSVRSADGKTLEPSDAARLAVIDTELQKLSLRMQKWSESINVQAKQ